MSEILIDTNAYAAFKQGEAEVLAIFQRAPRLLMSVVVLGELLGGFAARSRWSLTTSMLHSYSSS